MTVLDAGALVLDTETTGVDTETARLVSWCTGYATVTDGRGGWGATTGLVNPGIPIPETAAAVHGITDAMVVDQPSEADASAELVASLRWAWGNGRPVVVMNAPYDLTIIDRAERRAGRGGLGEVGPVIDPLVLDKACDRYRRGKRTLEAAARTYGIPFEGDAHNAEADAYTSVRVAHSVLSRMMVPEIADDMPDEYRMGEWETGPWPRLMRDMTLDQLQEFQRVWHETQKLSFFAYKDRRGEGDEITDRSVEWPVRTYGGAA